MIARRDRVPCLNCGTVVTYTVKDYPVVVELNSELKVNYNSKRAYCDICGQEVWVGDLDDLNVKFYGEAVKKAVEERRTRVDKKNNGGKEQDLD